MRVLVVDDDPDTVALARRSLDRDGIEAAVATSGEEALDILRRRQGTEMGFDVIVADHHMAFMRGPELLEQVAREHPRLLRVLMSAYPDAREDAAARHAHYYFEKPLAADVLRKLVNARRASRPAAK